MKCWSKFVYRIWKYNLQNGGHFVAPQYINYQTLAYPWLTMNTLSTHSVSHYSYLNPYGLVTPYMEIISGSALAYIMACYLRAPSPYLNDCWFRIKFRISESLSNSHRCNFTSVQTSNRYNELESNIFNVTAISHRGQYVQEYILSCVL